MQKLQLAIPEPCHQDWNQMTPNDQGRFCSSCAKTVVDFSAMTDAQLIGYFEKLKNENVCGRVYPDQLERSIKTLPVPKKKIFLYWQYVIAFFMMLGKGQSVKAQGSVKATTVMHPDTAIKKVPLKDDMPVMLGKMIKKPVATTQKTWKIVDENNNPVPFATLQFFPSEKAIAADENGLAIITGNINDDTVRISAVGFLIKTVAIKNIEKNIILILEPMVLGEVIIPTPTIAGGIRYRYETHTIITDTIQNILSVFDPSLTVYPNPVSKAGTLNISTQLKSAGNYKIDINDAAGHLLLQQNHKAFNKTAATQISIPAIWSAGIYYIIVYNEKGKKMAKGNFVIN